MITAQSGQHFTKRGGCTSFSRGVVRLATLLSLTPTTSSSSRRQAPLKKPSQVKIEGSPQLPLVHTYRWEIGWHTKAIVCLCNLSIKSENGVPKTVLVIFDSITKKRYNTYSFQSVSIPRVTLFLIFKYFIFAKLIHTSTTQCFVIYILYSCLYGRFSLWMSFMPFSRSLITSYSRVVDVICRSLLKPHNGSSFGMCSFLFIMNTRN